MKTILKKKHDYSNLPLDGIFEIHENWQGDDDFISCTTLMLEEGPRSVTRTTGSKIVCINKNGYVDCVRYYNDGEECEVYMDLLENVHEEKEALNKSLIAFYKGKIPFAKIDASLFGDKTEQKLITFAENISAKAIFEKYTNKPLKEKQLKKIEKKIDKALHYIQDVASQKQKELQNANI